MVLGKDRSVDLTEALYVSYLYSVIILVVVVLIVVGVDCSLYGHCIISSIKLSLDPHFSKVCLT